MPLALPPDVGFRIDFILSFARRMSGPRIDNSGGAARVKRFCGAIITHLTHSDWYRENIYRDAKDGWYLDAGGTYHYGVVSSVAIGRTEIGVRAGWQRTEDFNDMVPPIYASVGIGVGF